MIKKAVYTHYSRPYGSDIRNSQTHWLFPYLEFLILAYSGAKSKKFFGKTVLVTDTYGKELICDNLCIPFDEVIVELDGIEKKPRFWASGKIYGYTKAIKEFEPFIHFDNDAGFHIKPPEFTGELTVQHIHHEYGNHFGEIFKRLVHRIVKETKNEFPYDIYHEAIKGDLKGCNCGMIAFNDYDVWNEFSKYTWALQESEFFDKIERESVASMYRHFNYWNVVVEEILLYAIFKRIKKKEPDKLFDFNGFDFPVGTPNPMKYFHIWGSKRDREFLKIREKIAVDYLDKNVTDRIYAYFGRKKMI
ncbi:MAG TPA: hypothetical protein PLS10_10690 [Chitinophagales bacterium]|nr:hypothetical protein [Chitinophagales bacterium]